MNKRKKGFTLVELLAVIVILAIILVIAVPKVMEIITDSKKATLETTAKMIASQAEKQKVENNVLGKEEKVTCESVAKLNNIDYSSCSIYFEDNTAKVSITGANKFEGLNVCHGTKNNVLASDEKCLSVFEKDNWETIVKKVQSGNYPYEVGDVKTIDLGTLGTHTIRVSNTTPCDDTLLSQSACGFVLEFEHIISNHVINSTATNAGGWPASLMREYLNETIYNAIPQELRDGIINTYVVSGHGKEDVSGTLENYNYGSDDKVYLLSLQELYGEAIASGYDSSHGTSRQLDWYRDNNVSSSNTTPLIKEVDRNKGGTAKLWWTRSIALNFKNHVYSIDKEGKHPATPSIYPPTAHSPLGVSPAFRIGKENI